MKNQQVCDHGLCTVRAVKGSRYCRSHTFMDRVDSVDIAHAIRDSLDSMIGVDCMVNDMMEHVNHSCTVTTAQINGNSGAEVMIALDNGAQFKITIEKI